MSCFARLRSSGDGKRNSTRNSGAAGISSDGKRLANSKIVRVFLKEIASDDNLDLGAKDQAGLGDSHLIRYEYYREAAMFRQETGSNARNQI